MVFIIINKSSKLPEYLLMKHKTKSLSKFGKIYKCRMCVYFQRYLDMFYIDENEKQKNVTTIVGLRLILIEC